MKKSLLLSLLFCAVMAFGAEIAHKEFPTPESINSFPIWGPNKQGTTREYSTQMVPPGSNLKGSLKFVCVSGQRHPAESTPVFPIKNTLTKGTTYVMTLQVMSPQNLDFQVTVMRDAAPWTNFAKQRIKTLPGQWQTVKVEFTMPEDVKGVRVPTFFLGNLKPNDTIYVASMKLESEEPEEENPVPVAP